MAVTPWGKKADVSGCHHQKGEQLELFICLVSECCLTTYLCEITLSSLMDIDRVSSVGKSHHSNVQ